MAIKNSLLAAPDIYILNLCFSALVVRKLVVRKLVVRKLVVRMFVVRKLVVRKLVVRKLVFHYIFIQLKTRDNTNKKSQFTM